MGHEISQFDIQDRQLLAGIPLSKTAKYRDIGEAKVTRTIFGKSKVRVIREQDKDLHTTLLLILVFTMTSAAIWQGFVISQQAELREPALPPLSERIKVGAPIFQPAFTPPSSGKSSRNSPRVRSTAEIYNLTTRREPPPPQKPLKIQNAENAAPKPATAANKPQASTPATGNSAAENNTAIQQPAILSDPIRPVATAADTPAVTQPSSSTTVATPAKKPAPPDPAVAPQPAKPPAIQAPAVAPQPAAAPLVQTTTTAGDNPSAASGEAQP